MVVIERAWNAAKRLVKIGMEYFSVRNVFRYFAKAVHVIAECHQPGFAVLRLCANDRFKSTPDQSRPQHFLKGADMRQTRGAVSGLEQDRRNAAIFGFLRAVRIAFEQALSLLKRPRLVHPCCVHQFVHAHAPSLLRMRAVKASENRGIVEIPRAGHRSDLSRVRCAFYRIGCALPAPPSRASCQPFRDLAKTACRKHRRCLER